MLRFRFRGRAGRLLAIYDCIKENPPPGTPPGRIARATGMPMHEVTGILDDTPEMFVKLPRLRDGFTRYRLTPAINLMSYEDVEAYVRRRAQREMWMLFAAGLMILLSFIIAAILIGPALG